MASPSMPRRRRTTSSSLSSTSSEEHEGLRDSPGGADSSRGSSDDAGGGGAAVGLAEQLAAALMSVRAKEELVRKHAEVSEEAVSGWEKAEEESAYLRDQLEAAARENSSLADRVVELVRAYKECRRQLRRTRHQHEQNLQDAVAEITDQWRSEKFGLENLIIDLAEQLQVAEKIGRSPDHALRIKLHDLEMENNDLRLEILSLTEQLDALSRQRSERMKTVTALEAECRRLQAMAQRESSDGPAGASSASIAVTKSVESEKVQEIDLLDNFLEMDKLIAPPRQGGKLRDLQERIAELEKKIKTVEAEKSEMEKLLAETRDCLMLTQRQAREAERNAEELENDLFLAGIAAEAAESRAQEMQEKVRWLEKSIEEGRAHSKELLRRLTRSEEELRRARGEAELQPAGISSGDLWSEEGSPPSQVRRLR